MIALLFKWNELAYTPPQVELREMVLGISRLHLDDIPARLKRDAWRAPGELILQRRIHDVKRGGGAPGDTVSFGGERYELVKEVNPRPEPRDLDDESLLPNELMIRGRLYRRLSRYL